MLERLQLAGVQFDTVRAAIHRTETAGDINLGTHILRRFVLVIDYSGRAVWLQPQWRLLRPPDAVRKLLPVRMEPVPA